VRVSWTASPSIVTCRERRSTRSSPTVTDDRSRTSAGFGRPVMRARSAVSRSCVAFSDEAAGCEHGGLGGVRFGAGNTTGVVGQDQACTSSDDVPSSVVVAVANIWIPSSGGCAPGTCSDGSPAHLATNCMAYANVNLYPSSCFAGTSDQFITLNPYTVTWYRGSPV
jgi:hypothetical protein